MSEIIERVAKAMCKTQFGDIEVHGEGRCCQTGGIDGCCVVELMGEARAAIEAMREPTRAMLHASTMQAPTWDDEVSLRKWQVMIDEAVK